MKDKKKKSWNFLSSILILFILCSFVGCKKEVQEDEIVYEYLEPSDSEGLFSYINDELKEKLILANTGEILEDNQLEMIGEELIDLEVSDIDGNTYNLLDFNDGSLVIEVVQTNCTHCREQLTKYNDKLVSEHSDIKFIQIFPVDEKEAINNFYQDINKERLTNVLYITKNEALLDWVMEIGVSLTPTIICFKDGVITWSHEGLCSQSTFNRFIDYAFNNPITKLDLIDNNGETIFKERRTWEDVYNDLSIDNQSKLDLIDNDTYSTSLTCEALGRKVDFKDLYKGEAYSEISEFEYEDKNLIVFYIDYYKELEKDEDVDLLNEIIRNHKELEFIAFIAEDKLSSAEGYEDGKTKINCPVVSLNGAYPNDLYFEEITNYPAAVFVEKGVMTGVYSNIIDLKHFNKALDLFIGKDSIAHIDNN